MAQASYDISQLPGGFVSPELTTAFAEGEAVDVAKSIAPAVLELFSHPSKETLSSLFHPDGFWRDHVALSWSLRTFHPLLVISHTLSQLITRAQVDPSSIVLDEEHTHAIIFPNDVSVVRAPFTFWTTNPRARCNAAFKLIRMKNGDIKVLTVTTALQELAVAPWRSLPLNKSAVMPSTIPASVDVLVVGGGHGGLSVSAYLKSLGINFAMVERAPAIGDSWAKRYASTTLHTTRVFSGLPFMPFPTDYPEFVTAKLMAKYYAIYVQKLQLPAFPNRDCVSAVWDDEESRWTVTLKVGDGTTEVVTARHLIFAVGIGGRVPIMPAFPGMDTFHGESLHSATYTDASSWAGKRVAVVGSSTTACDVALDCAQAGTETVTMIQRGPTRIYPPDHTKITLTMFYNDRSPAEAGDLMTMEDPLVLQAPLSSLVLGRMAEEYDPAYREGLLKAGFLATYKASVQHHIFCRAGGHYPDVGACAAIIRGEIKVKSDALITAITPTGLEFSDGTKLEVDVIVYATGYEKDARKTVAPIIGADKAASLEPIWGLDAEGEINGCFRPTGNDHIWFHGGELQSMRYYGKFLAMQIAAELAKVRPTPCRRA
ncbi:hypothetical protein R3P38DRAFT_2819876 [Favolaschia claudopus]|uniref:Flavin-containing monooxygenase n=1 Tax=Favolaschia claudopus TaxID=2862362 RepID=A0AAW0EDG7_9AGAR